MNANGSRMHAECIPMVYPGDSLRGSVSVLVARESTTFVPIAGFGAKNPLGISALTGTLASSTHVLGSVITSVWVAASIAPLAPLQFGRPTSTTLASAGVAFANTSTPAIGEVLATSSVSVPLPGTVVLGVKEMLIAGTSPVCRLLGVAVNSNICRPPANAKREWQVMEG